LHVILPSQKEYDTIGPDLPGRFHLQAPELKKKADKKGSWLICVGNLDLSNSADEGFTLTPPH
jgi:hypothetical protein